MNKKEIIRNYYNCYKNKDKESLRKLLKMDFKFKSSYAEYNDRDLMLDEIWPQVLANDNKVKDLEIFENGNKFMVKYTLELNENVSMSEYIEFEDDLISKIEVYMGKGVKMKN